MNQNKHLLLASSIGVLALLIVAAFQENFRKSWRDVQAAGSTDQGSIPVQLRQITNDKLGIQDRCVSCHVSMGPGEKNVAGVKLLRPHKPVVHDPAAFGCTVCHGGQGLATEKADAHGDVPFWPVPMIPRQFAQAGCGACHAALNVPHQAALHRAIATFERLDCRSCHRVDERGGTIRPDGGGLEGPDLSRAGASGYDKAWYGKHLALSGKASTGPWRNSFGTIGAGDLEAIGLWLETRVGAPMLVQAKATFHSYGCLGCHPVSGVGGDEGPDLTRAGLKDPGQVNFDEVPEGAGLSHWIAEHFRSPVAVVANSQMPPVTAPQRDIDLLTLYVLSLRRRDPPGEYLPNDRVKAARLGEREFATDGATLYRAFCSGCHGPEGKGRQAPGGTTFPAITSPDFLDKVSDTFLSETIGKGRPGRRMPGWLRDGGLKPQEIATVVRYLRDIGGVAGPSKSEPWMSSADPVTGEHLYAANCSGCHGTKGEGAKGPALHNRAFLAVASDWYLMETVSRGRRGTAMAGFAEASSVRRALAPSEMESIVAYIRAWEGR